MKGNFSYHNPTKLYFGEDAMSHLTNELKNYFSYTLTYDIGGVGKENEGLQRKSRMFSKKTD